MYIALFHILLNNLLATHTAKDIAIKVLKEVARGMEVIKLEYYADIKLHAKTLTCMTPVGVHLFAC